MSSFDRVAGHSESRSEVHYAPWNVRTVECTRSSGLGVVPRACRDVSGTSGRSHARSHAQKVGECSVRSDARNAPFVANIAPSSKARSP